MIDRPQHYLVVDDDSTSNLICNFTILKFNCKAKIDMYLDPEKALGYIEKHYSSVNNPPPTILFLDVNMPKMSGFEFLDEFEKFEPKVRNQFMIYMLSSSIEDFDSQAKKYPLVAGFLSKPLNVSHLEEAFDKAKMEK